MSQHEQACRVKLSFAFYTIFLLGTALSLQFSLPLLSFFLFFTGAHLSLLLFCLKCSTHKSTKDMRTSLHEKRILRFLSINIFKFFYVYDDHHHSNIQNISASLSLFIFYFLFFTLCLLLSSKHFR
jgi:hypothetical protein